MASTEAKSASRSGTDERLLEDAFQLKLLAPSFEARDVLHGVGIELDRDDFDDLRVRRIITRKLLCQTQALAKPQLFLMILMRTILLGQSLTLMS